MLPHSPLHPSGYNLWPLSAPCTPSVSAPRSLPPSSSPCPAPQPCALPQSRPLDPTPLRLSPTNSRAAQPPGSSPRSLQPPAAPAQPHSSLMLSLAFPPGSCRAGPPGTPPGSWAAGCGTPLSAWRRRGTAGAAPEGVSVTPDRAGLAPLRNRSGHTQLSPVPLSPGSARLGAAPPSGSAESGTARLRVRFCTVPLGCPRPWVRKSSAPGSAASGTARLPVRFSLVPLGHPRPRVRPGSAPLGSAPLPWQRGPLHSPPPARPVPAAPRPHRTCAAPHRPLGS